MNMKYKTAWKEGETALYIDFSDRKFAAKNGSLAWRINNPGLIKHHCHSAKNNGSIGTWEKFAIFSNLLEGHKALKEWLQSKTISQSDLYAIAKHYQPTSLEGFAKNLASSVGVVETTKVKNLTQAQFESLAYSIEKLCGFTHLDNEEFFLLPKIAARIECPGKEDLYLVGNDLTLTHEEAVSWVNSNRLDAVVVHHSNGNTHLRSRPRYHMQTLKLTWEQHCEAAGEIDTLGWSFVAADAAHPESHNYASVGDLIPRMGSFNLQYLAIRRYEGFKEGLSLEEIISRLAFGDAIKDLDNFDARIIGKYAQDRSKYYREEFKRISNVTVVDSGSLWEHSFNNDSYQAIVRMKIDQYRPKKEPKAELLEAKNLLVESLV